MNKLLILLTALLITPVLNFAQEIQLIPYASYHWGGKISYPSGEIRINDSENFGIAMNVMLPSGTALQLEYFMQPTEIEVPANVYDYIGLEAGNYPAHMNWFQVGGMHHIIRGNLAPYAGITLGAVYFSPQEDTYEDLWEFALTGQVGVKYFISDKIGIRLHLGLLMPVQYGGFGFYFGTGGASAGVSASSTIFQGEVGGGLIIRLHTAPRQPVPAQPVQPMQPAQPVQPVPEIQ